MKTVSKLALAVTLMMGNIEFNTTQTDFYEDDSDFLQVSSVLETGWGWSLNKAYANDNCSGKEGSELQACQEEEVIEVIGTYDDESSLGDVFGDVFDDGGGDSGADAGGGGAEEELTVEERLKALEKAVVEQECVREAAQLMSPCMDSGSDELSVLLFTCSLVSSAIATFTFGGGALAGTACFTAHMYDMKTLRNGCQANVAEAMETCFQ